MICPKHQTELIPAEDKAWRGKLLVCPVRGCGTHQVLIPSQAKLPGLDRGKQTKAVRVSEAGRIKQAAEWAGYAGYEMLQVGQKVQYPRCPSCKSAARRIFCPTCGETYAPQLLSTSTDGTPDTFFGHRERGNCWKAIEWKRDEHAPVRAEQARLVSLGLSDLAWSLEQLQRLLE